MQTAEEGKMLLASKFRLTKSVLTAPSGLCGRVQTVLDPHSLVNFVAPVGRHECLSLIFLILITALEPEVEV